MGKRKSMTCRNDKSGVVCMYVCMLRDRPCGIAHGKGQLTGPRGEVPKWTHFPNPASKTGSRHTADRVLPLISGFCCQLCSRPNGFAEWSWIDQSGIPRPCKSSEPGNLGVRCSYCHDSASSVCGMYENVNNVCGFQSSVLIIGLFFSMSRL